MAWMSRPQVDPQDAGSDRTTLTGAPAAWKPAGTPKHGTGMMMTERTTYEIACHDGQWSVSLDGQRMAAFKARDRAVQFAGRMAERHHYQLGVPVAVCLIDGGEAVDIILHGEQDPAANALAWIRHVSALRASNQASGDQQDLSRRRA